MTNREYAEKLKKCLNESYKNRAFVLYFLIVKKIDIASSNSNFVRRN